MTKGIFRVYVFAKDVDGSSIKIDNIIVRVTVATIRRLC